MFVLVFTGVLVVVINVVAVDVVSASVVVVHVPLHFSKSHTLIVSVLSELLYVHSPSRMFTPVFPQAARHSVNSP